MKTLKTVTNGSTEIRLEQVFSKEDNRVLGYMISKFKDGLRYYLDSSTTIEETEEHFDFYVNAYK
tara:strand:- start:216 stop:410 length:195 start_codon:yes stop_codon:yes gene_type:complete